MPVFPRTIAILALPILAACTTTTSAPPVSRTVPALPTERLVDRKLVHESGAVVVMNRNGRLSGTEGNGQPIIGAWVARDGKFCRTITKPDRFAGTQCQTVEIEGDMVTFTRPDGTSTTYRITG